MKHCPKCGLDKPESEFHKNRSRADGLQSSCKKCQKGNFRHARSKPGFAERSRGYLLKCRHGITLDEFNAILASQGKKCAICGLPETEVLRPGVKRDGAKGFGLVVDHDHQTGLVRGLLCDRCNRSIGLLEDNPAYLTAAARYVESGGARYKPSFPAPSARPAVQPQIPELSVLGPSETKESP